MTTIRQKFAAAPALGGPRRDCNSARPTLRLTLISLGLFAGTMLLFSPALRCGFLNYDDPGYVTKNLHVQGGLSWSGLGWAFTAPTDYLHPLTWLSHMLDWQLYGAAPLGHHLTNVLWHAVNAVLAFFVFRRLAGGTWRSAFAAAVFAWHPLRVESVVWITERKDVLSGCFFLLTLLAYAHYADRRRDHRPWLRSYLLTLACFVGGLMSKPVIVSVPLILLILDWWPLDRWRSRSDLAALIVEKVPFVALAAATSVATVLMQQKTGAFVLDLPLAARIENAVVSLSRYLGKFVWPVDLTVCYPHPGHWPTITVLGAAALMLSLGFIAWRMRRSRPWLLTGLLWFMVLLLPVIGLIQAGFQSMADRYTYLPMLGIELGLLWTLQATWHTAGTRMAAAFSAGLILAALGVRSWQQQQVWRDSVSLFENAVSVTHGNAVAEDFLASALLSVGRLEEAAVHASRSEALNPNYAPALITFAGIRQKQGRTTEAIELYRRAVTLRPNNDLVRMELGLLEYNTGHTAEARRMMTAALQSSPELLGRTRDVARMAFEQGNVSAARFFYELILATAPNDAEAHVVVGYIQIRTGDRAGGLARWRHALELAPDYPGLREQIRKESPP